MREHVVYVLSLFRRAGCERNSLKKNLKSFNHCYFKKYVLYSFLLTSGKASPKFYYQSFPKVQAHSQEIAIYGIQLTKKPVLWFVLLRTLKRISSSTLYSTFNLRYEVLSRLHCSQNLVSKLYFFFPYGFSFTNIQESQDCRGRGRPFH